MTAADRRGQDDVSHSSGDILPPICVRRNRFTSDMLKSQRGEDELRYLALKHKQRELWEESGYKSQPCLVCVISPALVNSLGASRTQCQECAAENLKWQVALFSPTSLAVNDGGSQCGRRSVTF